MDKLSGFDRSLIPVAICDPEDRSRLLLQLIPVGLDPAATPIPRSACARLLGFSAPELDDVLDRGVLERSCEVSPFCAEGGLGPTRMSSYWDLVAAALGADTDCRWGLSPEAVGNAVDRLAFHADVESEAGLLDLDQLYEALDWLEETSRGATMWAIFKLAKLSARCHALMEASLSGAVP